MFYFVNSDKQNKANQSETCSLSPKKKGGKTQEKMDFQHDKQSGRSESCGSQTERKGAKSEDAMDVEQSENAGGRRKEVCSADIKDDSETLADPHPPPAEPVPSTSDGKTSRTTTKVEAFSGLGRTLSEAGKKNTKYF